MIRLVTTHVRPDRSVTRREWLRLGGLMGLSGLASPARGEAKGRGAGRRDSSGFGRAKSVIVIFANGGQSQFETWDPKPDAPAEVRGEFGAIASAIPGVSLGEHLPELARLADRYTIVRSVTHDDLDHGSALYLALTGRFHPQKSANPAPGPADFPTLGAVLNRIRPDPNSPYTAVHVNGPALVPELPGPGQGGGFLGREHDPMLVGDVTLGPSSLPIMAPPPELPPLRLDARRSLLHAVDDYRSRWLDDPAMHAMEGIYGRAYHLLDSPRLRAAFDVDAEPPSVRDRYGRHRSGQACLMARRLAEAEVPLITVFWNHSGRGQDKRPGQIDSYGWDTHNDIFSVYRDHLLPRFDQSLSALLRDLEERGLLDQTLVVCMGEFGRAPRIALEARFDGATPGRKHWAGAYSILLAGAGVKQGAVIGASDRLGAYPKSDPVGPWDIAATMLAALGVDPTTEYLDPLRRPFPATIGRPIPGLY